MSARNASQARRSRMPAHLSMERLERREVKAGNVSAWVDAYGTLNVIGDGAANGVQITQVSPTTYAVSGLNHFGNTSVNGGSSRTFTNVWNDVNVDLGNGDDYLAMGGTTTGSRARLNDDLFIAMGAGRDTVDIRGLMNRDANDIMTIDTGSGSDWVYLSNVTCRAELNVSMGSGNDRLTVTNSSVGGLYADLGADNDTADIRSNWFASLPTVEGGSGFDKGVFQGNNRSLRVRNVESWS